MTTRHKFELSNETQAALKDALTRLDEEIQGHRAAWDERSGRWQESEKGQAVQTWLESFDNLADALDEDNIETEPEEV